MNGRLLLLRPESNDRRSIDRHHGVGNYLFLVDLVGGNRRVICYACCFSISWNASCRFFEFYESSRLGRCSKKKVVVRWVVFWTSKGWQTSSSLLLDLTTTIYSFFAATVRALGQEKSVTRLKTRSDRRHTSGWGLRVWIRTVEKRTVSREFFVCPLTHRPVGSDLMEHM